MKTAVCLLAGLLLTGSSGPAARGPRAAPAAPSPPAAPPAAPDPHWPRIREGHYVRWLDRVWNTRKPARIWQRPGVGTLGQHNGTATYLGEGRVNRGIVRFDVRFDAGYLAPRGGGKHFMEIMSWVADRGDRKAIREAPSSRIELANLGDRPRCLVWNYGPHFNGRATKIFPVGPAFQPGRWYRIRFEWTYREPAGSITIGIDDRTYTSPFAFVPGTAGPGRFFLFGHVETTRPDGCLHFRNFRVEDRKRGGTPNAVGNPARRAGSGAVGLRRGLAGGRFGGF